MPSPADPSDPSDPSELEPNRTNDTNTIEKASLFKRAVLWIGLVCCLQFLVFAAVGVARGYSVQSWAPHWIMLAGIFLVMPYSRKRTWVSLLSSGLLILIALVSISQGRHRQRGEELYEAGKYEEAMVEFRKEIETWSLRLSYNYNEDASMFGMAECHSQLEQFGKARDIYVDMTAMFRGFHKGRAEEGLIDLDANLAKVADYEKRIAGEEDDSKKVSLLFDLAIVYRKLTCFKKTVEQYESIQSLNVPERFKEQALRFAEEFKVD